jgi:hypothetical protein
VEFARLLGCITTPAERELLLRWASRREGHVTQAELELAEELADTLRAFLERWELADVPPMEQCIAEDPERKL